MMKYTKITRKCLIVAAVNCLAMPAFAEEPSTKAERGAFKPQRVPAATIPVSTVQQSRSGGSATAVGPISATSSDGSKTNPQPDLVGPYMSDVQRRLKRAWFPPRGHEQDRTVVIFKIQPNGEVSDLRITTSSGWADSDKAALTSVTNASPFRRPPEGAGAMDIQFTYDYTLFTGGGQSFRRF